MVVTRWARVDASTGPTANALGENAKSLTAGLDLRAPLTAPAVAADAATRISATRIRDARRRALRRLRG